MGFFLDMLIGRAGRLQFMEQRNITQGPQTLYFPKALAIRHLNHGKPQTEGLFSYKNTQEMTINNREDKMDDDGIRKVQNHGEKGNADVPRDNQVLHQVPWYKAPLDYQR